MKKLLSLLLTLAMVLGMTITGFAADEAATYTISVGNDDNHTYEVYQIFTGDLSDKTLSNVKWGQNGTGNKGDQVSDEVLNALKAVTDSTSDREKLDVIQQNADLTGKPIATVSKDQAAKVPAGYYLIKDTVDGVADQDAATLYIVKIVKDVALERKASVPEVDKVIVDNGEVKTNEASIGDTVNYKFTGTMPDRLADYNTYFYKFSDTLSKGLTANDDITVTLVNGTETTDVTKYFYKEIGTYSATNGTAIEVSIQDILALNKLDGVTVDADTNVVVTYSAKLNENAVIAGENPNTVNVIYSNNPNESGTPTTTPPSENPNKPETENPVGETPDSEVVTYTTEITILKTDRDTGAFLPGTEFTLTGDGVNVALVTSTTFKSDANGSYYKLKDGTYTETEPTADSYKPETAGDKEVVGTEETPIYVKNGEEYVQVERVAPYSVYYVKVKGNTSAYDLDAGKFTKETTLTAKGTGKSETNVVGVIGKDGKVTFKGLGAGSYKLTETKTLPGYNTIDPIKFKINFDAENKAFSSDNEAITVNADNTLATTVLNKKGSILPETGGMGTTLFYLFGSILVLGAGVLLFTRKRMAR